MTEKAVFILAVGNERRQAMVAVAEAPSGHVVEIKPGKRTGVQNARMWAMLTEVSAQVDLHGQRLSKDEWKDVFTAALKRQRVVPGLDGGFVVLGTSTSRMGKAEMSELMELMAAFGAQQGVEFSEMEAT